MSRSNALQARLKDTSNALSETKHLIDRLQNFTHAVGQGDEARLELGADIHSRLKSVEDELEILSVEVEELDVGAGSQHKYGQRRRADSLGDDKNAERKRIAGIAERLSNDLKRTRAEFRTAQLQANRNAEAARRKERELLFAQPSQRSDSIKGSGHKLTQNDVVATASSDVTAALRRTHELMQSELSRSQFAQETLEQSTAALSTLSESYTDLDTILSSSRALVSSLLRSQKSDTWYLETSFYLLIGTISWLVFRRILYGPMWWLAWLPVKTLYNLIASVVGLATIAGSAATTTSVAANVNVARTYETIAPRGTQQARVLTNEDEIPVMKTYEQVSEEQAHEDGVLEKINQMLKGDNQPNAQQEAEAAEYDGPRNPKKRVWEEEPDSSQNHDEL